MAKPHPQANTMIQLYKSGLSIGEISRKLHINSGTIYRILKRNQVEILDWRAGWERAKNRGMVVKGGPGRGSHKKIGSWYL